MLYFYYAFNTGIICNRYSVAPRTPVPPSVGGGWPLYPHPSLPPPAHLHVSQEWGEL